MQAKASAQPAVRRRMAKRYATKAMPGQNEKAGGGRNAHERQQSKSSCVCQAYGRDLWNLPEYS